MSEAPTQGVVMESQYEEVARYAAGVIEHHGRNVEQVELHLDSAYPECPDVCAQIVDDIFNG